MKQFSLICILSSLLFISCNQTDDWDEQLPPVNFWTEAHTERMGLQGNVRKIEEYSELDNERFILSQTKFDAQGRVTHFYPVNEFESNLPQTYWMPTASQSFIYTYTGSQLTGIRVWEWGSTPVDYTLTYGNHNRYVPLLLLNLQPLTHCFVQGLTGIESSDNSVSFEQQGENIILRTRSDYQQTTYLYKYEGSVLPLACEELTTASDDESHVYEKRETTFDYFENGAIREMKVRTENEMDKSTEHFFYNAQGCILKHTLDSRQSNATLSYAYNTTGLLTQIGHTDGEGTEIGRMRAIYDLDAHRNWIRVEQRVTGFIDWNMREGTYLLYRNLVY